MSVVLRARAVSKRWPGERDQHDVVALQDVDLDVESGEFLTVIGPSGCGKSTLLDLMAGLERPTSGEVLFLDERLEGPCREIGVVFQEDSSFPWLTAKKNVEFGLQFTGVSDPHERSSRALDALGLVGLAGFEEHYPDQLSGGMRQRVNIARVLSCVPKVILMDEPFGALDELTRIKLGDELLRIWQQAGATIVLVTHSLSEAVMLSDRVAVMSARPGVISQVLTNPLPRPRSSDLIGSPEFSEMVGHMWHLLEESEGMSA